jgi:hypothetical protein
MIFGTLFVLSELIVVWRWRGSAVKQTAKAVYFLTLGAFAVIPVFVLPHGVQEPFRQTD